VKTVLRHCRIRFSLVSVAYLAIPIPPIISPDLLICRTMPKLCPNVQKWASQDRMEPHSVGVQLFVNEESTRFNILAIGTQNPPIARSWGFDPPSRHQQKTKDLDGLNMGCFSGWPGGCGRVAVSHRQLVIWRQIGVSGRHGGGERSRANDERIKNGKKLAPYGNSNSLHRKNMRTCKIEGSICIEKE
jgi:hypothetical protein